MVFLIKLNNDFRTINQQQIYKLQVKHLEISP